MRIVVLAVFALLFPNVVPAAAPATRSTSQATERAQILKEQIKSFRLGLRYHGEQGKSYYGLTLSVPLIGVKDSSPFWLRVQIDEMQAEKIIGHLATESFLDRAIDITFKEIPAPPAPCYTLTVWSGQGQRTREFYSVLGWGMPMLKRLDGLRGVLESDAAKQMDTLLGRLSGHRREWEKEADSAPVPPATRPEPR